MGIIIFGDGGSRGNPGHAACGYVCFEDNNKIHEASHYLGITTNNVAEYMSVVYALEWLLTQNHKTHKIHFFLDSELVTRQLKGEYKIKSPHLKPLYKRVSSLLEKLSYSVLFDSVPREKNSEADKLVNQELDNRIK